MRSFKAIVIDDERNVREALQALLQEFCPEIDVVGTAASAHEGRELLGKNDVDFIFLDISMPREDGFEFLQSINRENYGVIFITAFEEYALNAIKASAIDYLLKPVNPLELREAVHKAIKFSELRKGSIERKPGQSESGEAPPEPAKPDPGPVEKITVADQFGFRMVKVAELMYLEADSNYTILHLSGLEKIVATRTLGEFEKLLNNRIFFRIHKSILINLNYLRAFSSYEGYFAELTDGTRLSISRRKVNEFREAVRQLAKSPV
jgi:two-component system LytT family response regulator